MRFCEAPNCNNPVFSTCKISRKGYCRNHQYMKESFDRRSIVQRGIDKHKEEQKKRPKGWFDESVLESETSLPKSFIPPKWMEDESNDIVTPYRSFNPNTPMGRWFLSQRPKMKGICQHCGGKTMAVDKEADTKFHWSLAHLFPKNHFESIKTHEENVIELCYYSPSCHTNYDNLMIPITQLNCFDEVVRKFVILYPLMTREEKRRVPPVLLTYLDAEI